MSKIQFEQIHEDVVEVTIPDDTPVELVEQLTKSLISRGLLEDKKNSTLSTRYFYRPDDKANELADQLIKSLESLGKGSAELPHWHPKAQMAHQKQQRQQAIAERRAKVGIGVKPGSKPGRVSPIIGPNRSPSGHGIIPHDDPSTAGGTGRRYAFISDKVKKMEEHASDCDCGQCEEIEKSNYGPKGSGQYSAVDNARRKANNVEPVMSGPNANSKAYSTKPGQLSAKASADLTARIQRQANKKQPVKQWTPEEIEAENKKRGLKKSWGQHLPFPSAEEEIMKLAKMETQTGDEAAANQLANLMSGKSMLGPNVHPAVKAMMAPPPPQPTDEEMFGHLVVSEEMAKNAETQWSGTLNNFFTEATKPLSSRFASEEEEIAYWSSIKVADRDDGTSGY